MTAPTGKLVFTSYENREGAKTRLYIFGGLFVVGVLMCIIGSQSLLLLIGVVVAMIGAGFSLLTLPHALRKEHTLELYEDGFIWRTTNDKSIKQSALWSEVPDVTLPKDGPENIGLAEAGKSFGLAGLIVGAAADSLFTSANNKALAKQVLIMLPDKRSRAIQIDQSYSDSFKVQETLKKITKEVWLSEANTTLASGHNAMYGKLTLSQTGFTVGKRSSDWAHVKGADWSAELKSVLITYQNPTDKREQRHIEQLGYRGYALIDLVKQKIADKNGISVSNAV